MNRGHTPTSMSTRMKYILLVVVGAWVGVLTLITVPMLWQVRTESHAVKRMFSSYADDLIAGRFNEAYQYCGADFRGQSSVTEFIAQQQLFQKNFGRLLSVKLQGISVTGTGKPIFWSARISADLNYQNGPRRFEFALRKQTSQWVLYGFEERGSSRAAEARGSPLTARRELGAGPFGLKL